MDTRGVKELILPLLDALHWKGDDHHIHVYLNANQTDLSVDDLIDLLANLNYKHFDIGYLKGQKILDHMLPLLIEKKDSYILVLKKDQKSALVYDSKNEKYENLPLEDISGRAIGFKYLGDMAEYSSINGKNWFGQFMIRFLSTSKWIVFLTFLMTAIELFVPAFVVMIYDGISDSTRIESLYVLFFGVLIYLSASILMEGYRSSLTNYMSVRMGNVISKETFKKLMYLPPTYTETASISGQINRMKDFDNLKSFVQSGLMVHLIELVLSVVYIAFMFAVGGLLGFIPIGTLLLVLLIDLTFQPFNKRRLEIMSNTRADYTNTMIEVLSHLDLLKSLGLKKKWLDRSKGSIAKSIFAKYQQAKFVSFSNNIVYFITNASVILLIYGGVLMVFSGEMTMGLLIGLILIYWRVLRSIRMSSSILVQVSSLKKSIQQINRFMDLPQDTSLKTNAVLARDIQGNIRFVDVSIRYNKMSKAALINLSFQASQGEIFAISGHDGAGKTTILKLILGMYAPQGGRVLIDGFNIKQLEPITLRQAISYIPDREALFDETIFAHFKLYDPTIDEDRIMDLCQKTGFIKYMLRYGVDLQTRMSHERLMSLPPSFGKLLSITMGLARDVSLFLIDEPENHLSKGEIDLLARVFRRMTYQNKTIVLVTKSDQLIQISDKHLKLDQGRGRVKGDRYEKEA